MAKQITNEIHQVLGKSRRDRRTILKGAGTALTWGALASVFGAVLPRGVRAESAVGKRCLTILYNNGDDITFDFDYYRDNHLTMIMRLFGNSIKRFELRKPVSMEGAPPSAFVAAVNIWVNDNAAFDAGNAEHGPTMVADIPNYTNATAVIQNDEVWGEMGADLSSRDVGESCMTILYPNAEGVRWDADYYRDNHMPLIMRLYTTDAISRFEIRKGMSSMDGSAPAYAGCVNFYIASQEAFAAAGAKHTQALVDDVPNFSSVMPVVIPTEIYGIANT